MSSNYQRITTLCRLVQINWVFSFLFFIFSIWMGWRKPIWRIPQEAELGDKYNDFHHYLLTKAPPKNQIPVIIPWCKAIKTGLFSYEHVAGPSLKSKAVTQRKSEELPYPISKDGDRTADPSLPRLPLQNMLCINQLIHSTVLMHNVEISYRRSLEADLINNICKTS